MPTRLHISDEQRRARLVARHHLHRSAESVEAAVRSLVAVHSSDPITPYLALRARVAGFTVGDLDRALYGDRSLWRLHGMRRTLFVVAADQAVIVYAACGRDVAHAERRKLEKWVGAALDVKDPRPWLQAVESQTLAVLADGRPRSTPEVTAEVEPLSLRLEVGSGKWATEVPLSSRLLFLLAMERRVVRVAPTGSWLSSQYRWVDAACWFSRAVVGADDVPDPATGRCQLARDYLQANGPVTSEDLRWWAGWTGRQAAVALAASDAVEVDLDGSQRGWVLPGDEAVPGPEPSGVALVPGLDPTVMGWKRRDWYLGSHADRLFDRNGNAGPSVWVDGRIVGGWAQRPDGEVATHLLEDVGAEATALVAAQAAALTQWFAGISTTPRFRTPLEREISGR